MRAGTRGQAVGRSSGRESWSDGLRVRPCPGLSLPRTRRTTRHLWARACPPTARSPAPVPPDLPHNPTRPVPSPLRPPGPLAHAPAVVPPPPKPAEAAGELFRPPTRRKDASLHLPAAAAMEAVMDFGLHLTGFRMSRRYLPSCRKVVSSRDTLPAAESLTPSLQRADTPAFCRRPHPLDGPPQARMPSMMQSNRARRPRAARSSGWPFHVSSEPAPHQLQSQEPLVRGQNNV